MACPSFETLVVELDAARAPHWLRRHLAEPCPTCAERMARIRGALVGLRSVRDALLPAGALLDVHAGPALRRGRAF